jgi:hypothetical protein
MYNI